MNSSTEKPLLTNAEAARVGAILAQRRKFQNLPKALTALELLLEHLGRDGLLQVLGAKPMDGKERAPRATLHEHSRIDEQLVRNLATKIHELPLPARLRNILNAYSQGGRRLVYVLDLVQMSSHDVSVIPKVGLKSCRGVKKVLTQMGMDLGMCLPPDTIKAVESFLAQPAKARR